MPRGVRNEANRNRAILITQRVLLRVTRKGRHNARQVAAIVVASLSPARVRYGVVGPCFYCGDELATTVDHIVPLVEGGADDHPNVVSCCERCNTLKGQMSLEAFLVYYPFGCDRERNLEHYERWSELLHRRRLEQSA